MSDLTFNNSMEARIAKLEKMVWLLIGLQAPQLLQALAASGML